MDAWIVREPVLSWLACAVVSLVSVAAYNLFLGMAVVYLAATIRVPKRRHRELVVVVPHVKP